MLHYLKDSYYNQDRSALLCNLLMRGTSKHYSRFCGEKKNKTKTKPKYLSLFLLFMCIPSDTRNLTETPTLLLLLQKSQMGKSSKREILKVIYYCCRYLVFSLLWLKTVLTYCFFKSHTQSCSMFKQSEAFVSLNKAF